ncbi:uncharacterized protein [Choristoneura fumiferana]|uniref:uncharacterized protein n=1 Tax=Choristoneura fumiferana TaxID=7141 RepID=UPI003D15EB97
MSRSRRILDLLDPPVQHENESNCALTVTIGETNNGRKRKRESPLPENFDEELITQLDDLLGDNFDDPMSLVEDISDIIMNPIGMNSVTKPETPTTPNGPVPNMLPSEATYSSPEVVETNENDDFTPSDNILTPMPSPSSTSWLLDVENKNTETSVQTSSVIDALSTHEVYENMGTPSEVSSLSQACTPSSTTSSRKKTFKVDRGKKRLPHRDRWLTVQRKLKKNTGEEFVNKRGRQSKENK